MKQIYLALITTDDSLTKAEKAIRELSAEIKTASAGDFKIGMKTQASMLILFTSDVPVKDLKARMKGLAFRDMRFALFATDQLVAGFLDSHVLEWLAARLPREEPKAASRTSR